MEKIDKVDQAIAEAIEEFKNLVDDPENHEEFLWREKQLRDKISFLEDARDRGLKEGREEGLKQGIQEGRQEGLQEGIKQNQEEVVINMYKENMDIGTICRITNLTKIKVEEIINKKNK